MKEKNKIERAHAWITTCRPDKLTIDTRSQNENQNWGQGQILVLVVKVMRAPETSSVLKAKSGFVARSKRTLLGAFCLYAFRNLKLLGHIFVLSAFAVSLGEAVIKIWGPILNSESGGQSKMPASSSNEKTEDQRQVLWLYMILHHLLRLVGSPKLPGHNLNQLDSWNGSGCCYLQAKVLTELFARKSYCRFAPSGSHPESRIWQNDCWHRFVKLPKKSTFFKRQYMRPLQTLARSRARSASSFWGCWFQHHALASLPCCQTSSVFQSWG